MFQHWSWATQSVTKKDIFWCWWIMGNTDWILIDCCGITLPIVVQTRGVTMTPLMGRSNHDDRNIPKMNSPRAEPSRAVQLLKSNSLQHHLCLLQFNHLSNPLWTEVVHHLSPYTASKHPRSNPDVRHRRWSCRPWWTCRRLDTRNAPELETRRKKERIRMRIGIGIGIRKTRSRSATTRTKS